MDKEKWVTDDMQPGPYAWAIAFTIVIATSIVGWANLIFGWGWFGA